MDYQVIREDMVDHVVSDVQGMNPERIEVRLELRYVEQYKVRKVYECLDDVSKEEIIGHLAKLVVSGEKDEAAINFDVTMYGLMLSTMAGGKNFSKLKRHVVSNANTLLSECATIPDVKAKIPELKELTYELLEILAVDGVQELKKNLEYKAKEMQHLLGYGIVKEVNENFYITINAVNLYLENTHKLQGKKTSKEQAWSEVSKRRNVLEDKLRKIMLLRMTMQYGSKKVKGKLLEVVESGRKEREKLQDLEINDLIENHFYLLDVKQVILKNWSLFDVTFIDKVKFENFLDVINKYRIDAHAKTIEESDLLMLTLAFNWFDERIEDLPV